MGRLGQQRVAEQFEWQALTGEIARLCEEYAEPTADRQTSSGELLSVRVT